MSTILFLVSGLCLIASLATLLIRLITKKSKKPALVLLIIAVAAFGAFMAMPLGGQNQPYVQPQEQAQEEILIDDKIITAEYKNLQSSVGIEGFFLTLKVTNNYDKEIWVYLEKCSVNDEMIQLVMSGTPMYISAGKSSSNPFLLPSANISAKKPEDVKKIEFVITIVDNTTNKKIESTDIITINYD